MIKIHTSFNIILQGECEQAFNENPEAFYKMIKSHIGTNDSTECNNVQVKNIKINTEQK